MTVQLINVGRMKVNKTVEVKNEKALIKEVATHLMSSDVSLHCVDEPGMYEVIVGGYRIVGQVKILEDGSKSN